METIAVKMRQKGVITLPVEVRQRFTWWRAISSRSSIWARAR
jgi:bifunctional DNA-binding transcriptional regulator/antitoxin component of YhaV-PrlF toxin-antitoxin module